MTELSVVVLAWNELELTKRCVQSIRAHTDSDYELIVVDNGSSLEARTYAAEAADISVLHDTNLGFAMGMNSGLAEASGEFIAFVNNDTVLPDGWSAKLLDTARSNTFAGIVMPAVTKAGNPVTVRSTPGDSIVKLMPFGEFPSGVIYLLRRELIESLGGWNTDYPVASAEDLDLAFAVWAHGFEVLLDERVLVEHESQASVRHLENRRALYHRNLEFFLESWSDPGNHRQLLDDIDPAEFQSNLERAQTAVIWIRRMLEARSEAAQLRQELKKLERAGNVKGRWFRAKS